jgi:hypothetical protein
MVILQRHRPPREVPARTGDPSSLHRSTFGDLLVRRTLGVGGTILPHAVDLLLPACTEVHALSINVTATAHRDRCALPAVGVRVLLSWHGFRR